MQLDFKKENGLIPVIIQNNTTLQVLMLGYMNEAALHKTKQEGIVTFYSRSKKRLWTKGETSGNLLKVNSIIQDCDQDTLLILATPTGPICHTGTQSCFATGDSKGFLFELESIIKQKIEEEKSGSYTSELFKAGINRVAQKVGEEVVELIIEAKDDNIDLFQNEAADLIYHFLLLLNAKKSNLSNIEIILKQRNKNATFIPFRSET